MINFIKLRIPSDWIVTWNTFLNIEPKEIKAATDLWYELSQSLFQVEHKKSKLIIDLGWYPEFNPDGKFKITIVKDQDWLNKAREIELNTLEATEAALEDLLIEHSLLLEPSKAQELNSLFIPSGWEILKNECYKPDSSYFQALLEQAKANMQEHITLLEMTKAKKSYQAVINMIYNNHFEYQFVIKKRYKENKRWHTKITVNINTQDYDFLIDLFNNYILNPDEVHAYAIDNKIEN